MSSSIMKEYEGCIEEVAGIHLRSIPEGGGEEKLHH
jgi:hypothetical protein